MESMPLYFTSRILPSLLNVPAVPPDRVDPASICGRIEIKPAMFDIAGL